MRLSALVDGQPAIVAVESNLVPVRGCENRRNDSEMERHCDVLASRQNVVRGFSLNTGLPRGERSTGVLIGDPLATVIADRDVILATGLHHVHGSHVLRQRTLHNNYFATFD